MAKKSTPRRSAVVPPARPQTAFSLPPDRIESELLQGNQGLLEDYFGPDSYRQLRDLALNANTRSVRGGPRVLILPGIMGSTLSKKGALGFENTLWIDPIEIALGHLSDLKLGSGTSAYHASGVILFTYLKLKLRLRLAGFNADFFPYDWRQSLTDLGATLADTLSKDPASEVQLVAHSMGGLVSRAAMNLPAGAKVKRLIMLGTPNYGSYAPLQALRGSLDVVRKLQSLERKADQFDLASDVFSTFPGLHELLPAPGKCETFDIYNADAWPTSIPRAVAARLAAVPTGLKSLAAADNRFFLIAGVNQRTTVGVHMDAGDFQYEYSSDGDGTVPLAFARLEGIPENQTWYVEEQHGNLPNNGQVGKAVLDLLANGTTQALAAKPPVSSRAVSRTSETALRSAPCPTPEGSEDYRNLLSAFAAPERGAAAAGAVAASSTPTTGSTATTQDVIIGRRRQRRLQVTLAQGSLTDSDSQAYVLGIFSSVAPSGAAKAVDERLDGTITDFTARRIFSGDVGELFTLPAARTRLGADLVIFAGLGPFDRFNPDVHQLIAENIVRMMMRSHVYEFSTVMIGAGTGQSVLAVLHNLFTGFLRALKDTDPRHRFRGITLCETDAGRFAEMKAAMYQLAASTLCDDVEITLEELALPESAPVRGALPVATGPDPVYVLIRQESAAPAGQAEFQVSVLGAGMKAAVLNTDSVIDPAQLDGLLKDFDKVAGTDSPWKVEDFGQRFANLMLPGPVREVLASTPQRHVVFVHDAAASRIPWETVTINGWTPGVTGGVSRRYLADDLPIATWLEQRRAEPTLKLLLIVNPTENLPGAEKEGTRLKEAAAKISGIEVTELRGPAANKQNVLQALRSGKYDIVHYAGHAWFDPNNRGSAGLLMAGEVPLTGRDLAGASNLPFLVFFNACQAGRVRGGRTRAGEDPGAAAATPTVAAQTSYSVAETMMRGGIANFLSTYWPVRDDAADMFAANFYDAVLNGATLGAALLQARTAVQGIPAQDWADYILYGSYDFVLKRRS